MSPMLQLVRYASACRCDWLRASLIVGSRSLVRRQAEAYRTFLSKLLAPVQQCGHQHFEGVHYALER